MIWTNNLDLPQPLVDAVKNRRYTKGDAKYSITGLMKPPRAAQLEKLHHEKIKKDVSEEIYSLLGTVLHQILNDAERESIPDGRLFMELGGVRISGEADRFVLTRGGLLQDYKLTTIWKVKKGTPEDWEQQLNGYNMLLAHHGYKVNHAEIVAIWRDWSKGKALECIDGSYPAQQGQKFTIPIWPLEKTKAFFEYRIALHEAAEKQLPVCTMEEKWEEPPKWAVKKTGGVRALRLFEDKSLADQMLADKGKGHEIEYRPGDPRRCKLYCSAKEFCHQYQVERFENIPVKG